MIGLLDLTASGLVASALDRCGSAARAADAEAALAAIERGETQAIVIETERLDARVRALLARTRGLGAPALVVSRQGGVAPAVEALRAGASDYLQAPFEFGSFQDAIERLRGACAGAPSLEAQDEFLTRDASMRATLALARSIATSDATVLIEGESGTGKELLARLIHRASARRARPLISVNCAALPPGLLESELFGHERGAFTGAFARLTGKFELAQGTTILLDEIGELELPLQAKLLRVIQEKQVQPIGARMPVDVDFRLVATTNRDLAQEARAGRFREDLFYRLNVLPIRLAPLRERPGDIRFLAERFLERNARMERPPCALSEAALSAMERHAWAGNVRELENLIERLSLVMPGEVVGPQDLNLAAVEPPRSTSQAAASPPLGTLRELERWLIVETLRRREGNRTRAARDLGISLRTLRNKINEYRIDDPDTLPRLGTRRAATPAGAAQRRATRQELPTPPSLG